MENQNEFSNSDKNVAFSDVEEQQIISLNKFIFLSIVSFGTYSIWWIYKAWRFFQQKEKLDIMPAARAIFSFFFLISLFNKILDFAQQKGYKVSYSPNLLFFGYFVVNILSRLPNPYWLISLFSFVFLIPSFLALNYAKQNSNEFVVTEKTSFNNRQIVLIVIGIIFWILVLLGMSVKGIS